MPFRFGQTTQCHGMAPGVINTTPCDVEIVQGSAPLCLSCAPSNPIEWYVSLTDKGIYCADPSLAINPTNEFPVLPGGSYVYPGILHVPCPIGSYWNGAACASCHSSCATCDGTGDQECFSCITPDWTISNLPKGGCYNACSVNSGLYLNDGHCTNCAGSCNGKSFCPWNICEATFSCLNGCATCTSSKFNDCTSCESWMTSIPDMGACFHSSCGLGGPTFFDFHDGTPGTCTPCAVGCDGCLTATHCTTCNSGTPDLSDPSTCDNTACDTANGYYLDGGSNCLECGTDCKTCNDINDCLTCDSPTTHTPNGGQCTLCQTNNGFYIDTSNTKDTCEECQEDYCLTCNESHECLVCESPYYPSAGICLECEINSGSYLDSNQCFDCSVANCLICPSDTCTQCEAEYALGGGSTTCEHCPSEGFFIDGIGDGNDVCTPCIDGCLTCDNDSTCITCDSSSNYHKTSTSECFECDTSGNSRFVENPNPTCMECNAPCATCNTSPTDCATCTAPRVLSTDPDTSIGSCTIPPIPIPTPQPSTPPPQPVNNDCHSTCLTCDGLTDSDCLTCPGSICLTIKGRCTECPREAPLVTESSQIWEKLTLTWIIKQNYLNDVSMFYLAFSENEMFLLDQFDAQNLDEEIEVFLTLNFR